MKTLAILLLLLVLNSGCAMVPIIAEKQTRCASPIREFSHDFRETPDKVFLGDLISEATADGQTVLRFQFQDVLIGEDRILDVYLYQDKNSGLIRRLRMAESREVIKAQSSAVLKGNGPSRISKSITTIAKEEDVPYGLYISLAEERCVLKDYSHFAVCAGPGPDELHIDIVIDNLDWSERSHTRSILLRTGYVVAVPVDIVQAVVAFPFILGHGIWTGGH